MVDLFMRVTWLRDIWLLDLVCYNGRLYIPIIWMERVRQRVDGFGRYRYLFWFLKDDGGLFIFLLTRV